MAFVYGTTNSDILNAADGVTSGDDHVYGGDGNDTIRGLGGNDDLFGDDGRDKVYGGADNDWIEGGKGNDDLFGGDDNDILWGDEGDDELYGEDDNDYLDGGAGADRLDGGDGIDDVSYYGSEEGVHVSLSPFLLIGGGNRGGDAEGDTLFNIENLYGSRHGPARTYRRRSMDRNTSRDGAPPIPPSAPTVTRSASRPRPASASCSMRARNNR